MILTTEQLEPIREAIEQNAVRYWANAFICERITSLLDTIADLKRQLAEYRHEDGGWWTNKALDAYVQERVDRAVLAESEAAYTTVCTVMSTTNHGPAWYEARARLAKRLSANRATVKP